jgi:hypothetical protein
MATFLCTSGVILGTLKSHFQRRISDRVTYWVVGWTYYFKSSSELSIDIDLGLEVLWANGDRGGASLAS